MKRVLLYCFLTVLIACSKKDLSHTETAEIVAQSFYHKDNSTLKKYTTDESYAILSSLQDLFAADQKSEINFAVIEDTIIGDIAWVRYSTSFEEKPSVFKLVKEDGHWKVTEQKPREEVPI